MSNIRYQLSAAARLDLLDIWNHLAESASLKMADDILRDIERAIDGIADMPGRGHSRRELTSRKLLFLRIHAYLIIYRPGTVPLRIARVIQGARDIGQLLED